MCKVCDKIFNKSEKEFCKNLGGLASFPAIWEGAEYLEEAEKFLLYRGADPLWRKAQKPRGAKTPLETMISCSL